MSSYLRLSPVALSAVIVATAGVTATASAQSAEPLLLRYQGLIEGASVDEGSQITCDLSLLPLEGPTPLHQETFTPTVVGDRFVVTLGADPRNPLSPEIFVERLNLKVECDLDAAREGYELSVTERVGQTPRAAVAERAASVEGPVKATELYVGQGDSARLVVDALGQWVGAPIVPRHEDQALVVEGVWVGEVDSPRVSALRFEGGDATLTGDVESASAHIERVYLSDLYFDSPPGELDELLINGAREWVGGVNVSAARLGAATASSVSVTGALSAGEVSVEGALSAQRVVSEGALTAQSVSVAGALSAASAELSALTHPVGGAVLSASGRLVAPLDPQDSDADGFSDLVEATLGADLDDPASSPEDLNANRVADAFELITPPSALDEIFTRAATATQTATTLNLDPQTGLPWLAAEVSMSGEGAVTSAAVSVALTLTDVRTGLPAAPTALTLSLRAPSGETLTLHERAPVFAGEYTDAAPPSADWAQLPTLGVSGFWQLVVQSPVGVRVSVTRFQLSLGYTLASRVAVGVDLDLGGARRVVNLRAPANATDASTKGYVDTAVQTSAAALSAQTLSVRDALAARVEALDVRYPSSLQYRHRLLRPVDDLTGQPYLNNDASLTGGVSPSLWLSGVTAGNLDLDALDAFLTERGQGGRSALLSLSHHTFNTSTHNAFFVAHTQVENTTTDDIVWNLRLLASCDLGLGQPSSVSLNGVDQWVTTNFSGDPTCQSPHAATVTLILPALTTSDLVLVGAGGPRDASGARALQLAITNDSLTLPDGLRFVAPWAR